MSVFRNVEEQQVLRRAHHGLGATRDFHHGLPNLTKSAIITHMARRRSVKDTNSLIAGLLRDLAAVQKSKQSKWG